MKVLNIIIIGIVLTITSCAPSRFVEPLQKNELAVGGNLGGPLIKFGSAVIPLPVSAVEVGYGLDTNLTIHGGIHTTALVFNNFQMDFGCTYKFLNQKKYTPNLSVTPGVNFIFDLNDKNSKIWPLLDLNAYWNYGRNRSYFYSGFSNMFELSKTMANDQPQKQRWLLSPQIGHVLKNKTGKIQFTSEIKFLGLNQSNAYAFLPYASLTGKSGATGVYLGFRYIFK